MDTFKQKKSQPIKYEKKKKEKQMSTNLSEYT